MGIFQRPKPAARGGRANEKHDAEVTIPPHQSTRQTDQRRGGLPLHNHNGHKVTRGIHPDGESGRRYVHPWQFLKICFRSACRASMVLNVLWPVVPVAIAYSFARPDSHLAIFILNYIAIIPAANLVGFAGQELARKCPKVLGILLETTLGSIVEIILFTVLVVKSDPSHGHNLIPVVQAAILGSILATLLLCLGLCFFFGGMNRDEQTFDSAVSEVGSGLLLVAGLGLFVPSAFYSALAGVVDDALLRSQVVSISRVTAVLLLVAFAFYVWFQTHTHHGIYTAVLELDEEKDEDRHKDLAKAKLTLTECILALAISLACVSLHAVFLVLQIETIVERFHISDAFMGLILVPIVEKFAEHITAIDEAFDNQMNFAMAHVLGATIQTALLNAPLVVIIGWGLRKPMDLNFEIFMIAILILSIIVVGNFLRDGKSNYLEGVLCVIVYIIIGVTTFFYPDPKTGTTNTTGPKGVGPGAGVSKALAF